MIHLLNNCYEKFKNFKINFSFLETNTHIRRGKNALTQMYITTLLKIKLNVINNIVKVLKG